MGPAVSGGLVASVNVPAREGRDFGVRPVMVLAVDSGRALGVFCVFCTWARGNFLSCVNGFTEDILLGVDVAFVGVVALTLLFPGAVMAPKWPTPPDLLGVAGVPCGVPSLVVGRAPRADAGRLGGGMELSTLKKLDCLLPLATGDATCDKLSIVRSDKDGRGARLFPSTATWSVSPMPSSSRYACSSSRNPAREDVPEVDAERKASKSPS
jgi:hypothetical protein